MLFAEDLWREIKEMGRVAVAIARIICKTAYIYEYVYIHGTVEDVDASIIRYS